MYGGLVAQYHPLKPGLYAFQENVLEMTQELMLRKLALRKS